jgi:hypothetical protein
MVDPRHVIYGKALRKTGIEIISLLNQSLLYFLDPLSFYFFLSKEKLNFRRITNFS